MLLISRSSSTLRDSLSRALGALSVRAAARARSGQSPPARSAIRKQQLPAVRGAVIERCGCGGPGITQSFKIVVCPRRAFPREWRQALQRAAAGGLDLLPAMPAAHRDNYRAVLDRSGQVADCDSSLLARTATFGGNALLQQGDHHMKRVFVLGAGASVFAGYPLASDLWSFVWDSEGGELNAEETRKAVMKIMEPVLKIYPPDRNGQLDLKGSSLFLISATEASDGPISRYRIGHKPNFKSWR